MIEPNDVHNHWTAHGWICGPTGTIMAAHLHPNFKLWLAASIWVERLWNLNVDDFKPSWQL